MVATETARRDQLRKSVPLLSEILVEEDCPEDQYQCCICKGYCYLSQIICTCTKAVSCIDHADQLCACPTSKRTLRKRYSENQLEEILAAVVMRAAQPGNWRERLHALLAAARPPLKSMRALLIDGEKISGPLPELSDLRALVTRANAWVERVTNLVLRKTTGRHGKGRQEEAVEDQYRSPEELYELLAEGELLAFDAPEIMELRRIVQSIRHFRAGARTVLSMRDDELSIEQCRNALILGQGLNVELDEVSKLQTIVNRLEWFRKVGWEVDDRTMQYRDVVELLEEAEKYEIAAADPTVVELKRREAQGLAWRTAVERLLAAESIKIEEISSLVEGQEFTPTIIDLMRQLESIRKTALGWQTTAKQQLAGGTVNGAQRLCKAVQSAAGPVSRIRIPEVDNLQDELDYHAEWLKKLAAVLVVPPNKVNSTITSILASAKALLSPQDERPSESFSCFCRAPPGPIMVRCGICKGEYHPKCAKVSTKNVNHEIKCAMCERGAYDERPSLNAIAAFVDRHQWNFVLALPELQMIGDIVDLAIRFARFILPLTDPLEESLPCHDVVLLQHCLRKLVSLPMVFDAVTTNKNQRVIFEDWLRRRISEVRNPPKARVRPRKPKLVLKQSHEHEFHCICSTPPDDHLITAKCTRCEQGYHSSCVRAPIEASGQDGEKWRCPCCTVKEGKHHKGVEVRVQMTGESHGSVENLLTPCRSLGHRSIHRLS